MVNILHHNTLTVIGSHQPSLSWLLGFDTKSNTDSQPLPPHHVDLTIVLYDPGPLLGIESAGVAQTYKHQHNNTRKHTHTHTVATLRRRA